MAKSGEARREADVSSDSVQAAPASGDYVSSNDAANYIASMLECMRLLAKQHDMSFLAYLIGIASEEAANQEANRDGYENGSSKDTSWRG